MQQNSFQKNGMLNINNTNTEPGQIGRRSIQSIRDDMLEAKTRKPSNLEQNKSSNSNLKQPNSTNYRQRIENMKNFNRWK